MIIVGAGAAGRETLGALIFTGYKNEIFFFDTDTAIPDYVDDCFPVIKTENALKKTLLDNPYFVIAIGHPRIREKMMNHIISAGGKPANIICDRQSCLSKIPDNATIIQPGVVISTNVTIGKSCMIHSNSVIGHSVEIGDFVSISPLVSIVGPAVIGNYCFIGAGSVILPGTKIGTHVIVPAGSVVNRDLKDFETFA